MEFSFAFVTIDIPFICYSLLGRALLFTKNKNIEPNRDSTNCTTEAEQEKGIFHEQNNDEIALMLWKALVYVNMGFGSIC